MKPQGLGKDFLNSEVLHRLAQKKLPVQEKKRTKKKEREMKFQISLHPFLNSLSISHEIVLHVKIVFFEMVFQPFSPD